jgi:hypothetical protein
MPTGRQAGQRARADLAARSCFAAPAPLEKPGGGIWPLARPVFLRAALREIVQ